MLKKIFPFVIIFFASCQAKDSSSKAQMYPYEKEGKDVPEYIRQSTVFIPPFGNGRCTGTYAVYPIWGRGILTAGHCMESIKTGDSVQFCHSISGRLEWNKDTSGKPNLNCDSGTLKFAVFNKSADLAFIEVKTVKLARLKAAKLYGIDADGQNNPNEQLKVEQILEGAGYGSGEGQGLPTNPAPNREEIEEWNKEQAECKEVMKACKAQPTGSSTSTSEIGAMSVCSFSKKEMCDSKFYDNNGELIAMPATLSPAISAYLVRSGSMKISKTNADAVKAVIELKKVSNNTILDRIPPINAQSTGGDSGMAWWYNDKMVGVHWGRSDDQTSALRSLSYYYLPENLKNFNIGD